MTRDSRNLAFARFCISIVLQSQIVVLSWIFYQQTQDPMTLAWLGLAEAIPAILCGVIAGPLVDRMRPFIVYIFAYLLLGLLFFYATGLAYGPLSDLRWIAVLSAVSMSGAVRAFLGPSVFVMLPRLVGSLSLPSAIAFHQSLLQVASVVAPAGAGLILAYGGLDTVRLAGGAVLLLGLFYVYRFASTALDIRASATDQFQAQELTSGFRFIWNHPILRPALLLDLVAVLFGGAVAILPAFTSDVLGAGPEALGWLRAAPAIGAILMGGFLTYRPLNSPNLPKLYWAVAGFGLATFGLGVSTGAVLAFSALFFTGLFDALSANIRQSLLQMLAPAHLRGRIGSVAQIFITSSNEIGAFESGLAARLMGTSTSIVFGGVMTLFTVGVTAARSTEKKEHSGLLATSR